MCVIHTQIQILPFCNSSVDTSSSIDVDNLNKSIQRLVEA